MKDIADELEVSSVTVSKALNDKEGVGDELRNKIKKLADKMGYRYNATAKSMRSGLTNNIGVVIPERFTGDLSQSVYLKVYQQISATLEKYDYYGILNVLTSREEEELTLPRIYNERKVDGFIMLGQTSSEYVEAINQIDIPILFLDFYDEHGDIDSVVTDNFYGAYELTSYLMKNGHRKIAYVGNLQSTSSIQDRFLGYYKSLLEHNLKLEKDYIINDRDENGKYIDIELPEQLPTAFVCNCDQVAHNLVSTLKRSGYDVPEDCSVVGFDNDIYATITEPQLTTQEIKFEEMAENAVRFIVEKVHNPNKSYGRVLVKGRIIYRDSVKKINENNMQK